MKVAFGPLFPTANSFSWVGIDFDIENRLQETQPGFSASTLLRQARKNIYHSVPTHNERLYVNIRTFAGNLVGLGFLQSVSYTKPISTHETIFAVGKSGPNATFNLIFLGLGWPRVGGFVGLIIMFRCFPNQQNLVNRKHAINPNHAYILGQSVI